MAAGYATTGKNPSPRQLQKLLKVFSEHLRDNPDDLLLRLKLAEVLRLLGRREEAIAVYSSVAWTHALAGNLVQAIMLCKLILELAPEHSETQEMLAQLYASQEVRERKQAVPVRKVGGRWVADPTGSLEGVSAAAASFTPTVPPARPVSLVERSSSDSDDLPFVDTTPKKLPRSVGARATGEPAESRAVELAPREAAAPTGSPLLPPLPLPTTAETRLAETRIDSVDLPPDLSQQPTVLARPTRPERRPRPGGSQAGVPPPLADDLPPSSAEITTGSDRFEGPTAVQSDCSVEVSAPTSDESRAVADGEVAALDTPTDVEPFEEASTFGMMPPEADHLPIAGLRTMERHTRATRPYSTPQDAPILSQRSTRDEREDRDEDAGADVEQVPQTTCPQPDDVDDDRAAAPQPARGDTLPITPQPGRLSRRTTPMASAELSTMLRQDAELAYLGGEGATACHAAIQRQVRQQGRAQDDEEISDAEQQRAERDLRDTLKDFARGAQSTSRRALPVWPLFSGLETGAFIALINRLERRCYEAGTVVVTEGDPGDSVMLVGAGHLQVLKRAEDGDPVELARLGPGSFFGEFALLADQRRYASVRCIDDCELLELKRDVLAEIVREHPSVAETLQAFYEQRVVEMVLATSPLFQAVSPLERQRVADRFARQRFAPREVIVEQGGRSCFYVVLLGEVSVTCTDAAGQQVAVGNLTEGDYFGEMSLISGYPAEATVTAVRTTEALVLEARDFYDLAAIHPEIWAEVQRECQQRQQVNARLLATRKAGALLL